MSAAALGLPERAFGVLWHILRENETTMPGKPALSSPNGRLWPSRPTEN